LDILTGGRGVTRKISGETIRFPSRWSRYYESDYEPVTFNFLRENLSKGDVYIDCGGHIGLFAIVGARLVGETGRVFSFEPTPLSRSVLEKTVPLNNYQNIVTVRAEAVSRTSGIATFFDTGTEISNANSLVKTDKQGGSLEVKTVSLDGFVNEHGLQRIDCIKMDVEGSEMDALLGAKQVIEKYRPAISLGLHPFAYNKIEERLGEIWDVLKNYRLTVKYEDEQISKDWFVKQTKIFDVQCFPVK
jgi:FkbM family methyltransferase